MRFGVLGPLAVWAADGGAVKIPDTKVRRLLADLLVQEGRPVAAHTLIDDLWGDELPANPSGTLQTRVSQLRRALEDAEPGARALVVTQAPGYALRVDPEAVDMGRFRALARQARETADPRARATLLADALELWRGPAFADVAEAPFARAVVDRLDEERLVVIEEHAEARLELGEHHLLAAELAEVVARYPVRQRLRAAQMTALYRAGRQDEALAAYQDLRARLADELGLDPSPALTALQRSMLEAPPAEPAQAPPPPALPAALTELVGRDDLVVRLRARLRQVRLVTLTGPGGVGKTSVALEVARGLPGPALVELAALDPAASPDEVMAAIPADRGGLLVLDNCEHLVDQAAEVAGRLLRADPGLRVLATSREPLGILGEQVWPVPTLGLPDAVRLFAERASAADPGFGLTPANTAAVEEICRRLDGLPLALELAASRVRALSAADLAARLDDRFHLLTNGHRGAPDRQRTLLAVIEWSWDLLEEPERVLLRRLAVYPDVWSLRAAEALVPGDVAGLLARLVDRSLITPVESSTGSRYRMLETVRAFCLRRLRDAGEYEETRARYLAYHDLLAGRSEPRLCGYSAILDQVHTAPAPPPPGGDQDVVAGPDGSPISVRRRGRGPRLVLVGGALTDQTDFHALAVRLSRTFEVVTYDRRGRGASGDAPPYDVAKEIGDLGAVLGGEGAAVLGLASGGVLAAEAAAAGLPITHLIMLEPPFILPGSRPPVPAGLAARLTALIEAGRAGDAVEDFLTTAALLSSETVAAMRALPRWRDLEAMAATIPHDLAVMGDFTLPAHWPARVTVPALVVDVVGSDPWRRSAARAVTGLLPRARNESVTSAPGREPAVLAPLIEDFLRP
ncbi:BTAD domain-containing putative transcriptional regulator [Bailinhaonella thermotolerans]|uniref:BTAD domain-containing putative transcriptional regulator n=1 Tax=Bailinhaonella thermotolerans TaxID=1070861 RepID=UPI001F5B66CF|nr:BTAD domain-containing putative transcriptional regulator [Bailinhaonella thermotolerans]